MRSYKNGDTKVIIKNDGTKIRWGENPELPESIDLKITDFCSVGCPFCHESSTQKGIHGDKTFIYSLIGQMIRGSELAIGGGNPLDHPELEKILIYAKAKGVYANLTVNSESINGELDYFLRRNLISGLGISIPSRLYKLPNSLYELYCAHYDKIVFHLIAGIHDGYSIEDLFYRFKNAKVLILGFKSYGFGKKVASNKEKKRVLKFTRRQIVESLPQYKGRNISFDNLAVKQLMVKKLFPEEYERSFMGEDGQYTMYVDAVTQTFARSSTSDRISCKDKSLREMFRDVNPNREPIG